MSRKETIAEFLARGGTIKRIVLSSDLLPIVPVLDEKPIDPLCVCCGRAKGHRHWCVFIEPKAPTAPLHLCDRCGNPLHSQNRTTCTKCLLSLQAKTVVKLCVICGDEFTPTTRFGRFACPTCR